MRLLTVLTLLALAVAAWASTRDGGVSDRPPLVLDTSVPVADRAGDGDSPAPLGSDPAPGATESTVSSGPAVSIPVASGRYDDVGVLDEGPAPVRIVIPSLNVDAPVAAVGYVAETDEMEVPERADLVGWYEFGPPPGAPSGSSVLAAHVDYNGLPGVFFDLYAIEEGASIEVVMDDGSVRRFRVVSGAQYDKDDLPVEEIFAKSGEPVLTLVTCGGAFDRSARSYEDNVVVVAVPE